MELVLKRTLIESPVVPFEANLDAWFEHAVPVNNYQTALQICLEALGATNPDVIVVLPVTSSTETIAAVLRAGGYPCLLDIQQDTLQMDPKGLDQVLAASKEFVVVLNFPGGWDIHNDLKKICDKYNAPTVIDSRLPPSMNNYGPKGTFTVYDFGPFIGGGALIYPGHDSYRSGLMLIRSGILGHFAHMSAPQANAVMNINYQKFFEEKVKVVGNYKEACDKRRVKLKFDHFDRYVLIEHDNARQVISKLNNMGLDAMQACIPLNTYDVLKNRWPEDPSDFYPVAKYMQDRIVALPTSDMDTLSVYQAINAIAEVL